MRAGIAEVDEGLGQGAEVQQMRVSVNEARDDGVPFRSMMRESGPALARTVPLAPTASTFPARMAIASATV